MALYSLYCADVPLRNCSRIVACVGHLILREFRRFRVMSFCWKNNPTQTVEASSAVSIDRYSTECTSTRHKTGNYNGIPVFVKFVESESLTLSRDDLLELQLVIYRSCLCISELNSYSLLATLFWIVSVSKYWIYS